MVTIQRSACGNYIRIIVNKESLVITIGAWSQMIAKPGVFVFHP